GARIDFVVREDLAGLARALPGADRVVEVPRRAGCASLLQLARRLARQPYMHVFDLHHSLRSRLLTSGLRSQLRPGFSKQEIPRWTLIHLHRNVYARFGGAQPLRQRMLEPLRRMGHTVRLHETQLMLTDSARQRAAAALRSAGVRPDETLIGVAPGARWPSKCWPAERYAALVERLSAASESRFVLVGGTDERSLAFIVSLGSPRRCSDLCGQLDILETAAVLERCRFLLTNDSGLLHVAEAVGRPVLAFFGSTAPEFGYVPYRPQSRVLRRPPSCSPCSGNGSRSCMRPTHECMMNIGVDEAFDAATGILRQVPPSLTTCDGPSE
ncbi:MAG: glycosyltransferase family 9 protein, partial [Candidatus Krumholzibacteriia bacterium]